MSAKLKTALALHQQGQLARAEALYQEILQVQPDHFDALQLLATACTQRKDSARAVELFDRALGIDPNHAESHNNRGNALLDLKRPAEALESYEHALKIKPDYVEAHNNRGNALLELKRPEDALESYDRALKIKSDYAEALNNRGTVLIDLKRPEEALESFESALKIKPNYAKAHNNLGNALLELRRPEDALESYECALRIKPDFAEAHYNRGNVLRDVKRSEDALASYERALRIKPNYAEAHWNESLCQLLMGDFERGWPKYEWRWKGSPELACHKREFARPLWLGETPIAGKTVLLHAEQGFGDTLQFCRYAPLVAAQGAHVVLEVPPALKSLCRSLPGVETLLASGEPLPPFDCHVPLLSLPLALGTRLDSIPADIPYLRVDPARVAAWQDRLGSRVKPRIGLAWSGSSTHTNDHNRTLPFSQLAELIDDSAEFICLQKEFRTGEEVAAHECGLRILKDELKDYADTAALIEALDLVIAVDTSVAHLAGALGKPVWILLPFVPDWRWLLDREDSPWYPSARLFRQKQPGQWGSVVAAVAQALARQFAGYGAMPRQRPCLLPVPDATAAVRAARTAGADAAKLTTALALHQQGQLDQAEALYLEILQSQPGHFDALQLLATIAMQRRHSARAVELFDRILESSPGHAESHGNRGVALQDLKRPEQALASYESALKIKPDYPEALYNRGNVLRELKRPAEALASYERALALKPDFFDALNKRGLALQELNRPEEALASYERALELRPDHVDVLFNRGIALQFLERAEEALASYERALELKPDFAEAFNNLGVTLDELARPEEALASYVRALALKPDYADANWNEGLCRLLMGDFERGWRKYEWRWKKQPLIEHLRTFPQPLWLGDAPIGGKTVLLHAEQGLGDTLQFCRYAPLVAAQGARIVLEVQPALKSLCRSLAGVDTLLGKGEALPPFDCHAPLLSLPLALGTRLDSIPTDIPYLHADPVKVAAWHDRLGARGKPRIGLVWSGNQAQKDDHNRSAPFAQVAELIDDAADFICLHKEFRAGEEAAARECGVRIVKEDLQDFTDTAALIETLDLVITVCTSVAHLAGALGKPVWILLRFGSDWRWLLDREDSPWYPSARLFRQKQPGQWGSVVAAVAQALARQFAGYGAMPRQRPCLLPVPDATAAVRAARTAGADAAKLTTALALHQQGQLDQAEALYLEILQSQPEHFDALQLLGTIAGQRTHSAQAIDLFDRALRINPNHGETHYNRGLALQGLKRLDEALASYEHALALKPDHANAFNKRGLALKDLNRPEEALKSFERALELKPDHVDALFNRGNLLASLNRNDEALASYERALALKPDFLDALYNRGNVLGELNRREDALASFDHLLALKPDYVDALNNRGNILRELKRFEEALASYDSVLELNPNYVAALNNRGNILRELERPEEALASYERALALKPDDAAVFNSLGIVLRELKRPKEALASYQRALELKPDSVDAFNNRGNVLRELKRLDEAVESYRRALELQPDFAEAFNNLGIVLNELGRLEEALASYERALELKPEFAEAFNNYGITLNQLGRLEDALASYARALALKPDYVNLHGNESLCRLLMGDFERGWQEYEWRWKTDHFKADLITTSQPLWLGDATIRGKTVLLHAEQGFGDTLQFCRYAPLVAAQGARIVLEVQPELKSVCQSLAGVDTLLGKGEALPPFDCHTPLLSLPLALGTRLDSIPTDIPYLHADPVKVAAWHDRLGPRGKPRIGLAWSGRSGHKNDHNRTIPFRLLAELIDATVEFICVHREFRAGEEAAARECGVRIAKDELKDFADTAALIETLDLVITVDTSVAHLAGALGKAVWILLPYAPDWRWLLDREDSPWYPSARLFRQKKPGQWAPVVAAVVQALAIYSTSCVRRIAAPVEQQIRG